MRFAEVNLFGVYVAPISGIMVAANVLCTNRTIIRWLHRVRDRDHGSLCLDPADPPIGATSAGRYTGR